MSRLSADRRRPRRSRRLDAHEPARRDRTHEPDPATDPDRPPTARPAAVGQRLVEFIRTQRQTAAYVLLALCGRCSSASPSGWPSRRSRPAAGRRRRRRPSTRSTRTDPPEPPEAGDRRPEAGRLHRRVDRLRWSAFLVTAGGRGVPAGRAAASRPRPSSGPRPAGPAAGRRRAPRRGPHPRSAAGTSTGGATASVKLARQGRAEGGAGGC